MDVPRLFKPRHILPDPAEIHRPPDLLKQLGFLKVLKGSYMEGNREAYGLVCKSSPPYEVLYTKWLSASLPYHAGNIAARKKGASRIWLPFYAAFQEIPPRRNIDEVLYTKWLSYQDVLELKGIEEMVEIYYNSGQFAHTVAAATSK